jgi:hypothetical protein
MRSLQLGRKVCPRCLHHDTARPARRKPLEYFLMLFLVRPYRCQGCGTRFWDFA